MDDTPETVICQYHLKPGAERDMLRLIARHWPTLHRAGLVTDDPPLVFRRLAQQKEEPQRKAAHLIVEIFAWKSARSAGIAHESPEVMAIWEPMGTLCEAMEFPHFEPLRLDFRL